MSIIYHFLRILENQPSRKNNNKWICYTKIRKWSNCPCSTKYLQESIFANGRFFFFAGTNFSNCDRLVFLLGIGDRKRAPFLVLGLAPWYGTNSFLFLEQVAPSAAAHARRLLREFSRVSRRGNGVRNSRNRLCFWPTTQGFYGTWNFAKYFRRKLLHFEWRQCRILGMSRFISLTKLSSAALFRSFYKNFTLLQSKFHIWRRL